LRLNVYSEELTNEVELVTKKMEDGRTFYGLRVYLKSPPELHATTEDDDRSAITFWVPWTKKLGTDPNLVYSMLQTMKQVMDEEFG
jgi:hypothetical protein